MKKCPACGMTTNDELKFCNVCGNQLVDMADAPMDSAFAPEVDDDDVPTTIISSEPMMPADMGQNAQNIPQFAQPNYNQPQQPQFAQPNYNQPQQPQFAQPNYNQPQQPMMQQPMMQQPMYQQPMQQMRPMNGPAQPVQPVQFALVNVYAFFAALVSLLSLFVGNFVKNPNGDEGFNCSDMCETFRKAIDIGYNDDDKIFVLFGGYAFLHLSDY